MRGLYLLLLTTLLIFSACSDSKETPSLIFDEANILEGNDDLLVQYSLYNKQILHDFDIDFRVITTTSPDEINLFSNKRFASLKTRSSSGKTLLLVLNTAQDKTRVEVSMALEPIYTDAFVSYIERKGMVPYFRDSKIADGIYMMSELVRDRAYEASIGQEFMPSMTNKSIGAGAKTQAHLGKIDPNAKLGRQVASSHSDTPKIVLEKYFQSLKEHNKNPNLDIFTENTKNFLKKWTVTEINMDNELRFAGSCTKGKFYTYNNHTVLVHPLKPRTCAPYLFKIEDGQWKLDIYTMAKTIRFNQNMMWHFDMAAKPEYLKEYEFGFSNLKYDKNGFPFYKKKKKLKWGFGCGDWSVAGEEKNRCWINWLDDKARAKNDLGLKMKDRIIAYGQVPARVENPNVDEFMGYMQDAVSGEIIIVEVIRDEKIQILETRAP